MDPLVERVQATIREHELLQDGERVLVGISGGVDSIVLADTLLTLGHPLKSVHVNYGLRDEESDADEVFVERWCKQRGVQLSIERYETRRQAKERGHSIQQTARELRYEAFAAVARASGIGSVAVGHHRDDQAETVLLNLFRGTGPEGLAGMPIRREVFTGIDVQLVRPLLFLSRGEIEEYALRRGVAWRRDATNTKTIYRRGALRGEIIPTIERYFGASALRNVARSAELMRAYLDATLDDELRMAFEEALMPLNGDGALLLEALGSMPDVVRCRVIIEALRRWMPDVEASARTAAEIEGLVTSQPGKRLVYSSGEVWRERDRLLFVTTSAAENHPSEIRLQKNDEVTLREGILRADELENIPSSFKPGDPNVAFVDARLIDFPLCVRTWREGDRFSPLGMSKTKKLSDFLTDERVRPHRKQDVLVVTSNDQVVWVVGHRIAHGVRVTDETTAVVCLQFEPDKNTAKSLS